MPKVVSPLTDLKCRNAKAKEKPYALSDGKGLRLSVGPDGGKTWRFDYTRPSGKRNSLSFGAYPAVSLEEARQKRDAAKKQLANHIDPGLVRLESEVNTFKKIALEWIDNKSSNWSESHKTTTLSRLTNNVFPWLGSRPIKEITPMELLAVLKRIESRGAAETAHRCRSICGQIFRFAIASGRAEQDAAAPLQGALQPWIPKPYPALTDPEEIGKLLVAIDAYTGHFTTKCALKLAPLTFQRPGELRHARWSEFDLESATWAIPVERMKLNKAQKVRRKGEVHIVPLSRQALEIICELQPLTGNGDYLFPSVRTAVDARGRNARPISENTLNAALRYMGFDKMTMTSHGWRSIARSKLDEILDHKPTAIERQLFHSVADPLGESYNRAQHFDERRVMMQRWADYLDVLKTGKNIARDTSVL